MVDRHVDDLVDAYALGALEPDEVDAVERHLDHCPDCQELAQTARDTAERMLLTAPVVSPPPELRQRVLARIRAERAQSRPPQSHLATDATARDHLVTESSQQHVILEESQAHLPPEHLQQDTPPEHLQHHIAPEHLQHHVPPEERGPQHVAAHAGRLRRALSALFGDAQQNDAVTGDLLRGLLTEPDCVIWQVTGTADSPEASARLIGSPSRRDAVIVTYGLAQPPPGEAYQVWFLRDGRPVPNAMLTVDRTGRSARVITARAPLADFDTIAITREPAEGSLAPTGSTVLAGALTAATR